MAGCAPPLPCAHRCDAPAPPPNGARPPCVHRIAATAPPRRRWRSPRATLRASSPPSAAPHQPPWRHPPASADPTNPVRAHLLGQPGRPPAHPPTHATEPPQRASPPCESHEAPSPARPRRSRSRTLPRSPASGPEATLLRPVRGEPPTAIRRQKRTNTASSIQRCTASWTEPLRLQPAYAEAAATRRSAAPAAHDPPRDPTACPATPHHADRSQRHPARPSLRDALHSARRFDSTSWSPPIASTFPNGALRAHPTVAAPRAGVSPAPRAPHTWRPEAPPAPPTTLRALHDCSTQPHASAKATSPTRRGPTIIHQHMRSPSAITLWQTRQRSPWQSASKAEICLPHPRYRTPRANAREKPRADTDPCAWRCTPRLLRVP